MKFLIPFLICAYSIPTIACFSVGSELRPSNEEMVKNSPNIYLVEVVEALYVAPNLKSLPISKSYFSLKVIETLKGKSEQILKLEVEGSPKSDDFDFDSHKDKRFWEIRSEGRLSVDPDCEFRPGFVKGRRYLAFPNKPYTFKSFELIKSNDDRWLQWVKKEVAGQR